MPRKNCGVIVVLGLDNTVNDHFYHIAQAPEDDTEQFRAFGKEVRTVFSSFRSTLFGVSRKPARFVRSGRPITAKITS